MQYVLQGAVFLLMISVGMSLRLGELLASWRRLSWTAWLRMPVATFVVPAAIALAAGSVFRLTAAELSGLFLVGVTPGAPLLTRNMAKKGFDLHIAASYQVWAALMVPVMIPLLVGLAGKLYSKDIWIPPSALLWQIVRQQFLPLAIGMTVTWFAPQIIERVQPIISTVGNVLLMALIVILLFVMRNALKEITPLVLVAALLIAIGSIAAIRLFMIGDQVMRQTVAVCNANRHVGLALLLCGQYLRVKQRIACHLVLRAGSATGDGGIRQAISGPKTSCVVMSSFSEDADKSKSGLTVEAESGGLEVATKLETQSVVHPPCAGCDCGSFGACLALDKCQFVLAVWIQALEL